ncbi:MAG: tRNA (adenosine(37)-N6)-threonylcarbamoyltransferase complex ATPase subunit type 1 TsaE [Bryobacteraceae bacterium]
MLWFETSSAEETEAAGKEIARHLPHSGLVLLIGNLGAGKTTLAKGIVEGLGVAGANEVTSPTYTIVHEYGDPVQIYHVDLYRLETVEEVRGLGLDDLLESEALVLVEWGERFPELFTRERYEVLLAPSGESSRSIHFRRK